MNNKWENKTVLWCYKLKYEILLIILFQINTNSQY